MLSFDQLLDCQRPRFDLPDDVCWLNSAYMTPLLHRVRDAGLDGVLRRGMPWQITAEDFFEPAERVRKLFGGLIGADEHGISLVPSVSYGVATAVRNLPIHRSENIVVVEEQFPSNVYPWHKVAESRDATIRTVAIPDGDWTDAIIAQIDDQTAVVAIPHIHWTTGAEFDLLRIGQAARKCDATLLIDATQSLGTLSLDVRTIRPDFLVASAYKGMLGPYGLTYMYVAPRWRGGNPLEEGWLNRKNASDFRELTNYCDEYASGARRFDVGERSSTILLPMAIASLEQLTDWKISRIENYTRPLVRYIVERARGFGLRHPEPATVSSSMVGIGLPESTPPDLGHRLAERGVHISVRKDNARVAVHMYNTLDDIDRFYETLREVAGRRVARLG